MEKLSKSVSNPIINNVDIESRCKKFFEKSIEKHGDKYLYDKVVYINAKTKVSIGCKIHGYFEQTPDKHLNGINCCPLCNETIKVNRLKTTKRNPKPSSSFKTFLKKVELKFGDIIIDINGKWEGIVKSTVNVYCDKHGLTATNARNLIQPARQYPCTICSKENRSTNKCDSKDSILLELQHFNTLYNIDYIYSFPDNYKTKRNKINIKCPKHGDFNRTVQKLLSGQYCSKCRIEFLIKNNILIGGYSEIYFENNEELKNIDGFLYYLDINNGQYYKIGITKNNIEKRKKSLKSRSKGVIESIREIKIKKMKLYDAFILEQKILNDYSEFRVLRPWSTELFKKDIINHILKYFK